ncbi:unnamed protein product, partial [Pylaiella littoralis]
TRWDICCAVIILTRGMSAPTDVLMVAAKRVLCYLRGTPDLPTMYHKGHRALQGFMDSDFAADDDVHRSCTGFFVHVMRWHYFLCCCAANERSYLLNLLRELGVLILRFSRILSRLSSPSLQPMISSRTRHIATKYHLLHQLVDEETMAVSSTPTRLQLSYCSTKNVPKPAFLRLRK